MQVNDSKLHSTIHINLTITRDKARHKVYTPMYVQKQANVKRNISNEAHFYMIKVKRRVISIESRPVATLGTAGSAPDN